MSLKIEKKDVPGYEEVVYVEDPSVGLKGFISIHNSNRGPACGGIRMLPYATQEEALDDVLRLSKGMSYKSSLANIGFGGGKSVIIQDPRAKSEALFLAFGEAIQKIGGRYIGAKDMNIASEDLAVIKRRTPHILGVEGEKGTSGDPSPVTAQGVLRAMEATAEHVFGTRSLKGLRIGIQGIGHVGYRLMEHCLEAGAKVSVSDINEETLKKAKARYDVTIRSNAEILADECEIFSPCARGAILNEHTIPALKCKAICGAANNQLAEDADGEALMKRGILYAPDYAVNSGGIINIFVEYEGYDAKRALRKADEIYTTMKEIFERSDKEGIAPFHIADRIAEERMSAKR